MSLKTIAKSCILLFNNSFEPIPQTYLKISTRTYKCMYIAYGDNRRGEPTNMYIYTTFPIWEASWVVSRVKKSAKSFSRHIWFHWNWLSLRNSDLFCSRGYDLGVDQIKAKRLILTAEKLSKLQLKVNNNMFFCKVLSFSNCNGSY